MLDKVIVITGASAGIGRAAAREMTARGATTILVARRRNVLEDVAAACGPNAVAMAGDVTSRGDVQQVVRSTLARFGRIDIWINNAGRGITRMPSELTDEDVDDMIRVNVKSVLYGMQETLLHFKARGTGHVINVSSMLGRLPFAPMRSAYAGAKHFVNALTIMFRAEVQQTHPGIQYSLVSPGIVRTDFGLNAVHGGPDSRQLPDSQSAEDVARVIAEVVESRRPDVYTRAGWRERVIGHFSANGEDPEPGHARPDDWGR